MLQSLTQLFGNRNQRMLKKMRKMVAEINALEAGMQALSDAEIAAKTDEFKQRAADGESALQLLPEAFAAVREASVRTLGLRHFDVQLLGGMVLHQGKIAEMKTGEGKTLVATLPAYLNAVVGEPVHIVTVNDYLAKRDAEWMGKIYGFLGLQVGVIVPGQEPAEKKAAYACDIVYGTNNEYGFDYLRDNMAFTDDMCCQRGLGFAVVDEVDSILIDEARTPLIISGPAEESTDLYQKINAIAPKLTRQETQADADETAAPAPGDFSVDEKNRNVTLTEAGHEKAEALLTEAGLLEAGGGLYEIGNIGLMHHVNAALRAHHVFQKDVHYIVQDGAVVIIDEFTGRMMAGRRWGDGLHQAVEAKEGVAIQQENQTLASITFQNYFRLYDKLAGMTGTADTEAPEFVQIYGLEVVVLPTNKPMRREDAPDLVYRTAPEKYAAIVDAVKAARERNQPVLVGTASIDASEFLSKLLAQNNIAHQVLNAKHHEREAEIIAEAGRPGNVTIATNMAGRGTDIVLGGNLEMALEKLSEEAEQAREKTEWRERHDQVIAAGGLHVLGTERNESRRVDNQLRGRCGRQGDPGSSQFYLSLEDNLMRIFGSDRISGLMQKLGLRDGEAVEHPWVTRAIENAQKKVEGHNFDARKQLLEYDDVANEQRKVIYRQRNQLMRVDDISENIEVAVDEIIARTIDAYLPPQSLEEQWDIPGLERALNEEFGAELPIAEWLDADDNLHEESLRDKILRAVRDLLQQKTERVGEDNMRHFEKALMLQILDEQWKEHLFNMDHLRQGIGLRGYAQKNPKQEYKREAFEMFTAMLDDVKAGVVSALLRAQVPTREEIEQIKAEQQQLQMRFVHAGIDDEPPPPDASQAEAAPRAMPSVRQGKKIGRNEPCPCGSGKKYKQCHGKL